MLIQVNGIYKSYGVTAVLTNITMQIRAGERVGLVGVNGAGKSTLLQIIAGEIPYDQGDIFKAKETRIGYLAQNSGLQSDESIWDELLSVFAHLIQAEKELRELEVMMADPEVLSDTKKYDDTLRRYSTQSDWFREQGGYEMEAKVNAMMIGMGFGDFDPNTAIHTLSGGQKTRLALAKMLLQAPDILLLDEPTNHLDIPTLTWLENYLRAYSGAVLIVSHDRYFLNAVVNTIYEIERHQSKRYTGNYTKYIETKAADYEAELKQYEKQQGEISRMEEFVQRNIVRASTTKRAQSRRNALERMDRLDRPLGDLKKAKFSFEVERASGKEVLEVRELTVSFDSTNPLFRHLGFYLRRGETVALIGPNGVGKSTLLKTLMGEHLPDKGTYQWGANVSIGYYDQEQTTLTSDNTVLAEVWNAFPHMEEVRIRTVLGNFLFSGEDILKRISSLSGGEKARVALTKLMLQGANVLLLDEPTNHLDLYSREVLEASLMDYEGTLFFISHDRYFLNKMAERIVELSAEGGQYFLGNYDEYVEKKQELVEIAAEKLQREAAKTNKTTHSGMGSETGAGRRAGGGTSAGAGSGENAGKSADAMPGRPANHYEADKQAKREERSRQRRLEQLEQDIAQLEADITALEEELGDPKVFNDYLLVQEKSEALEKKETAWQKHYSEWESLLET